MPFSTVSFPMTLSDHEWLSEIFSDTKHRAVSLRQLSFLFQLGKQIWRTYSPVHKETAAVAFSPRRYQQQQQQRAHRDAAARHIIAFCVATCHDAPTVDDRTERNHRGNTRLFHYYFKTFIKLIIPNSMIIFFKHNLENT